MNQLKPRQLDIMQSLAKMLGEKGPVKITTSLLVASTLSSIQSDIKKISFVTKLLLIIGLPMILVIFQPDAGTALVFLGLFFVLLREGMDMKTLYFGIGLISIFILTLVFDPLILTIAFFNFNIWLC